ncbi:hypothetical protein C0Q70_05307 [Pomacea canaliculata]|uniref:Uncharacterized protein n=1 Tax=Pomacea canaliculata TaxID=400727 RepID=A0A2T7PKT3_POMCA|nr:hypothetical protein C0Q70_05307 [Pomacea canaliculata]
MRNNSKSRSQWWSQLSTDIPATLTAKHPDLAPGPATTHLFVASRKRPAADISGLATMPDQTRMDRRKYGMR